jgi:hypothetical protein
MGGEYSASRLIEVNTKFRLSRSFSIGYSNHHNVNRTANRNGVRTVSNTLSRECSIARALAETLLRSGIARASWLPPEEPPTQGNASMCGEQVSGLVPRSMGRS